MSDETRNVRLGRLSRKESIELSKVIFSNMTKRGLSATDLAAVLEQSVTTASKKLRGLTTWSDNDLKIISEKYGPEILKGDAVQPEPQPKSDRTALKQAPDEERMTAASFCSNFRHALNQPAQDAVMKYAASFPNDARSVSDWIRIAAAFTEKN